MKFTPKPIRVIIDTREQTPWTFPDIETERSGLTTGDYSVQGMESILAIERKSLSDMVGCVTSGRERFERELERLRGYRYKMVIIEANWCDISGHTYKSKTHPNSVIGTIMAWQQRYGVPFNLAGNRDHAQRLALVVMRQAHSNCVEFGKSFLQVS